MLPVGAVFLESFLVSRGVLFLDPIPGVLANGGNRESFIGLEIGVNGCGSCIGVVWKITLQQIYIINNYIA